MFCGNVLDKRMVSFLFSYEFKECLLIYTLKIRFDKSYEEPSIFFKTTFSFFKDERSEKDATYPL